MRTLPPLLVLAVAVAACAPGPLKGDPAGGTADGDTTDSASTDSAAPVPEGCNGDEALCDRALAEVTFPGTHNSMSNADAGWIAPNQQHGLTRQLEDGVRALMLDTYEWEGGLYLCHAWCELGAQPLAEGLGEIEAFLAARPDALLLLIFQDAISVEQTAAALAEVGLDRRLAPAVDPAAPLRAYLDAGQQLIVGLESGGAHPIGLHPAWGLFADTPYSFDSAAAFSCAENRGDASSPLFLVNHWVGTPLPDPAAAAEVNAAAVLEPRARQCADERGRAVTFLGVDFYDRGDLFAVVRRLNGLD
jgi:hypothetical protein